ncbi:hydroxylysine kinase-like [Suncus etruscus]|uniref:hydroxylysine kinase-like n=1 Tax=Suncus etruscus TaxID=109475 RepID=UPI00210FF241|nr:hydroxylysine kinase-like [Suncus etruscus]
MASRDNDQPSQTLAKPTLNETQASVLVESLFGLKVFRIEPLPSYNGQNFLVFISTTETQPDDQRLPDFVLKINTAVSNDIPVLFDVISHVSIFLQAAGFPTASLCLSKKNNIISVINLDHGSVTKSHLVRLLTYLPGRPAAEVPITPQLLFEMGRVAAQMDQKLEDFQHAQLSALHRENFVWNLKYVPLLERYLGALSLSDNREVIGHIIQQYREEVVTKFSQFRECINHGDLNDYNILVEPRKLASGESVYQVSGILDFGDMSYGYYVFEVAILIMYMMLESKNPIQVGGYILAGFESIVPLTYVERSALYLLVCGRFCQSLIIGAYSTHVHSHNSDFLVINTRQSWKNLQRMLDLGQNAVEEVWFETVKSYKAGKNSQ